MKLLLVLTILTAFVTQSFNVTQQEQPKKLKNIKVFPATATYQEVDHAMDQFKADLGVKCNYCHAPEKDNPRKMDMPSDENPNKNIARDMIRMTNEMNNKYIASIKHTDADTSKIQLVTCNTCHRGAPKPFAKPLAVPPPPGQGPGQGPKPFSLAGK